MQYFYQAKADYIFSFIVDFFSPLLQAVAASDFLRQETLQSC
jgi:hypothetical protein